jgi:hypothetical protein
VLQDLGEGSVSRWLSALLVTVYVILAFATGGLSLGTDAVVFCLIPCCCVWFPEAMGSQIGGTVTRESAAIACRVR